MVDILDLISNNFSTIIIVIISTVGGALLPRLKASPGEKTDKFTAINTSFEQLSNRYERVAKEWEERYNESTIMLNQLRNEMEIMKGEIALLSDYQRKYYSLLDWAKDVYIIVKEKDIEIPEMSFEVMNDIKKRE